MSECFLDALAQLLEYEGGYSDDSADSGGETYKGISRRHHGDWEGWSIVDMAKERFDGVAALRKGDVTPVLGSAYQQKLEQLVRLFYKDRYWDKIKGEALCRLGSDLAAEVFDMEVNSGRGVLLLQEVLEKVGQGVAKDGIMGPKTLAAVAKAVESYSQSFIVALYRRERALYYAKIVWSDPKKSRYIVGWIGRALRVV